MTDGWKRIDNVEDALRPCLVTHNCKAGSGGWEGSFIVFCLENGTLNSKVDFCLKVSQNCHGSGHLGDNAREVEEGQIG